MASERRFRLAVGLQLPPGSKGPYIPEGEEVSESQLAGLNVEALMQSKWVEPVAVKRTCPACEEDESASKAKKAKAYDDVTALREHYAKEHPALAAPSE